MIFSKPWLPDPLPILYPSIVRAVSAGVPTPRRPMLYLLTDMQRKHILLQSIRLKFPVRKKISLKKLSCCFSTLKNVYYNKLPLNSNMFFRTLEETVWQAETTCTKNVLRRQFEGVSLKSH